MIQKAQFSIIVVLLISIFYYILVIKMTEQDRFDSLFQYHTQGTCFNWKLFKWMALVESGMDLEAVSPAGAIGLLQIMPETAKEIDIDNPDIDLPFNAEEQIIAAIDYFSTQFNHFPEIPDGIERLKFSLAAYNGGRGYINKAISLAKRSRVDWQKWDVTKKYLAFPSCRIKGKAPDHRQILSYVSKIMELYQHDKAEFQEK